MRPDIKPGTRILSQLIRKSETTTPKQRNATASRYFQFGDQNLHATFVNFTGGNFCDAELQGELVFGETFESGQFLADGICILGRDTKRGAVSAKDKRELRTIQGLDTQSDTGGTDQVNFFIQPLLDRPG